MQEANIVAVKKTHPLLGKWDLYYHLPQDKKWDINSYQKILGEISSVETSIIISESLPDKIIKHCMLFAMRKDIKPMWEDSANCNGGCFSFKVLNKVVVDVWKDLFYSVCGETLFKNRQHNKKVTGITVSPKRNFCVVKIWMRDCSIKDPTLMIDILNLSKEGCLFKKHAEASTFKKR